MIRRRAPHKTGAAAYGEVYWKGTVAGGSGPLAAEVAGGSAGSVMGVVAGDEAVEAEIADYGLHVRGEENVARLDIAVDIFLVVDVG